MAHTDAVKSALRDRFTAEQALPKAAAKPQFRFLSLYAALGRVLHRACCCLLTFDPWMRRIIPLLLIIFLLLCAVIRSISLYEWRQSLESDAAARLSLAAAHLAEQINTAAETGLMLTASPDAKKPAEKQGGRKPIDPRQEQYMMRQSDNAASPQIYLQTLLAQFMRSGAVNAAAQMLALDKNGIIVAASPNAGNDAALNIGLSLSETFTEAKPLLILGNAAGTMSLSLHDKNVFAAYAEASKAPYGIFLILDKEQMLQPWQRAVSVNITVLGSMACLMLILIYAYFAQGNRARASFKTASSIQNRIDTAMLRGRCGLWDWDLARGRIYWSHSMYEMLGYRPYDTLLSVSEIASVIDTDDFDLFDIAKDALSGKQKQFDMQVPMRHATGRAVWMRIRAQVLGENDPHLVGISFDISEQQELAEKNATADMRIRDAIENISEAFVLWDSDAKEVMSNSKYREYSRVEAQSLQTENGKAANKMAAGIFSRPGSGKIAYGKDRNGNYAREIELANGEWLKLNGRKTKDGGFVLVGTDISALKQQQRQLLESREDFIGKLREAKAAREEEKKKAEEVVKLNSRLITEKKRAEEANIAKSEFLANMSHELRTPLNAVIGFSQMILQNTFGPLGNVRYQDYINDIHNSGRHLLALINEILDMSKIEAGRFAIERVRFDFAPVLEEAVRSVSVLAEEKQIKTSIKIASPLWIEADSRSLRQITLNLLSNAVKFTRQGGNVRVRAKIIRNHLIVAIGDSGIGIPKTALDKLGRPFEQVENQLTKTHEGSGLGLAISRSLAELHKGKLRIFSRENKGTVVCFMLPAHIDKK